METPKEQLRVLLMDLDGKSKASPEQLVLMFNLHNVFYPQTPEYSKHCPSCVIRVYKRLKQVILD